ncbi:Elongation [Hypsibius exemplaris]|uniref:Elongation n=1 Tax=Hypsibius exemplaris TaxID=2072580 RepID=A0A1W0WHN6_HYPEX|nr:Elongation [Hypsibius exemplaris]
MRTLSAEELVVLRRNAHRLRNICILAHVDHGKTSLADSLVASNGIISQRMAGRLRYMDSRPDEQERGITMKSSAIALHHTIDTGENYLINLIDSPGHVDFSGEVSTAVRICDGAVVVVDVVEGCAPQTVQVLRQAWLENIRPILIINKIDRLILEKKMTPLEAYARIRLVLEQINAVMGSLFATETMLKHSLKRDLKPKDEEETGSYDWDAGLDDADDSTLYFQPEAGNVIFASALDGWGFTIEHFAEIYSRKLGVSRSVLRKTLWGDFYLNVKEKKVMRGALAKGKRPLFVQFVLENIWQVYDAVINKMDKDLTFKITEALGLKIHARETKQADPKLHLFAICSQWLPLGKAVLDVVCDKLPGPSSLSAERVESLISNQLQFDTLPLETQKLKDAFLACSPDASAATIVFVSKMFAVDPSNISRQVSPRVVGQALTMEEITARREQVRLITAAKKDGELDGEGVEEMKPKEVLKPVVESIFVGFARIFSGTLKGGDELFVLGPKHKPEVALELARQSSVELPPHVTRATVGAIYTMMGRELEKVSEAAAGNVVAIAGLQDHLVRSGTLSSTVACPAFTDLSFMTAPIVRVAVEPKRTSDMEQLARGLKLLYQADPCVEVYVQETGEHVIVTAGEVHLQRCLNDLTNTFAKIEITASEPIVPFRETVVVPPKLDTLNEAIVADQDSSIATRFKNGLIEIRTPDKQCLLKLRCIPLPAEAASLLERGTETLKALNRSRKRRTAVDAADKGNERLSLEWQKKVNELRSDLEKALLEMPETNDLNPADLIDRITCFGPRYSGPNVLINTASNLRVPSVWSDEAATSNSFPSSGKSSTDFSPSIITGFQLTTLAGPLCEEPMMGVCFVLQEFTVTETTVSEKAEPGDGTVSQSSAYGPLSGQLISTMKEGCRRAFQAQPQRLMVALYSSVIQTTSDVLEIHKHILISCM